MSDVMNVEEFYKFIEPNEGFEHGYTLTDVKEFKMRGGVAWTGTIRLNGVAVIEVEDAGNGGCYSYHFSSKEARIAWDKAVADAYYMRDMIDVEEDCFVNHLDRDNK